MPDQDDADNAARAALIAAARELANVHLDNVQLEDVRREALESARDLIDLRETSFTGDAVIGSETGRLIRVAQAMSEQVAHLAKIADAALTTIADAAEEAKRSNTVATRLAFVIAFLTATLVGLTYGLFAEQLTWWPFSK
jgi:hypothetical protein